jgi:transcriptional regulator with XRE-family HTH domain
MTVAPTTTPVGALLRDWRERRRLSQLELASRAGVSARHLSFVETGRSRPTGAMILRLCEHLEVPLREQNRFLLAGGFAPVHPERALDEPSMAVVHDAVERVLAAHAPYPALVVDQGWDLVSANEPVYALLDGVAAELLEPPVNVIRLTLHPDGLAPRIVNLPEWRHHLLDRLRRELAATGDDRLRALLEELSGYPCQGPTPTPVAYGAGALVVPLRLRHRDAELGMFSTTTVFGTPREVTVSELAIESFYPVDDATRAFFADLAADPAAAR